MSEFWPLAILVHWHSRVKMDIPRLAVPLGLPEGLSCQQRTRADRIEGLCMVLKRFTCPCRLSDMIHRFGCAVPVISMITTHFEKWIYDNHHSKITEWNDQLLSRDKLQVYADVVAGNGAALSNCFGFVDSTVRPICRPGENQKIVYNGPKLSRLEEHNTFREELNLIRETKYVN